MNADEPKIMKTLNIWPRPPWHKQCLSRQTRIVLSDIPKKMRTQPRFPEGPKEPGMAISIHFMYSIYIDF